jgi:hypothetical protein
MLGFVIDENLSTDDELSWQPEDQNHEDLIIQEYTKASLEGTSHFLCVDWKSGQKTTANYYLLYTIPRKGRSPSVKELGEPVEPSMEQLENMERPLPYFIQEMSDCFFHHFVGEVNVL